VITGQIKHAQKQMANVVQKYGISVMFLVFWSIFMMRTGWDRHKNGDKRPQVFFGLGGSGEKSETV
jgi:hypothetical protein